MIKRATGNGLVPTEQHGLWDHNCLEVVLTKTFVNYMMTQKLWDEAEGLFDMQTCYDRVMYN